MKNNQRPTDYYKEKYGWFPGDFTGIKSKERVKKYAEVLTPRWLAEMMIDALCLQNNMSCEGFDIEKTVFEPCCGEGAFITCVLRRKLSIATTYAEKVRSCQTCYGLDIQYDNVLICRQKLTEIASSQGVDKYEAEFIFSRNIIHGDMLFFPMIARFYDWKENSWTTLEEMKQ